METLWQLVLAFMQNIKLIYTVLLFFIVLSIINTIYNSKPCASEDLRLSDWTAKNPLIIHDNICYVMWLLTFFFITMLAFGVTSLFEQIPISEKIYGLALPGTFLLIIYSHRYLLKKRRLLIHSGAISSLEFGTIPWKKILSVDLTHFRATHLINLRVNRDEIDIHSLHWQQRLFLKQGISITLRGPDRSIYSIFNLVVHYHRQAKQAQSQAFVPPSD